MDLFEPAIVEIICGIDEAGRGPLAGPVCAAAVVLDPSRPVAGLNDSKQLSEKKRDTLAPLIRERALAWAVGWASVEEIDEYNIRQANFLAMKRAFKGLGLAPTHALVDGKDPPPLSCKVTCIIGGDALEPAISAASILAKTSRDALMVDLCAQYPGYGFSQHKGYGSASHMEALRRLGPSPAHRRTFAPVRDMLGG
ncbi:MAG: ribonuclease HII [Rhodobacterales bacterium 12-64-8]|nr:MAG: ribonuclease HII [Rhodobacterales bacterium 12-64-8]OYX50218.1 MAG: ribonuclease HII [Alphaproteobacteria bacterium 32-64-14]